MSLINCEINLILTWSEDCILISGGIDNQESKFAITDITLCVPVVDLSTLENVKLLGRRTYHNIRKVPKDQGDD